MGAGVVAVGSAVGLAPVRGGRAVAGGGSSIEHKRGWSQDPPIGCLDPTPPQRVCGLCTESPCSSRLHARRQTGTRPKTLRR